MVLDFFSGDNFTGRHLRHSDQQPDRKYRTSENLDHFLLEFNVSDFHNSAYNQGVYVERRVHFGFENKKKHLECGSILLNNSSAYFDTTNLSSNCL